MPDWLILVAVAPFIGSFLSVLVVRLPKGEDVVVSRSHCRACNQPLMPHQLIPLASWALQRGRCAKCGAPIGLLYPGLELGAVLVVAWAMTATSGQVLWVTVVLGWILLALATMDLRDFILADVLTLPLILAGLAATFWLNPDALTLHVVGAACGFALLVGVGWAYERLRGREGLGMGDAKLMAAAGAWTGLEGVGTVLLEGALLALAAVAVLGLLGRRFDAATPIPFGAGIAAGFWLTWLYGPLLLGA